MHISPKLDINRPGRRTQAGAAGLEFLVLIVLAISLVMAYGIAAYYRQQPISAKQYYELQLRAAPTCNGRALVREFAKQRTEASAHEISDLAAELAALNRAAEAAEARRAVMHASKVSAGPC